MKISYNLRTINSELGKKNKIIIKVFKNKETEMEFFDLLFKVRTVHSKCDNIVI